MQDIAVIIVAGCAGPELLSACLQSVSFADKIIVIDNDPQGSNLDTIAAAGADIETIEPAINLHHPLGVLLGFLLVRSGLALVLHDDMQLLPGAVKQLQKLIRRNDGYEIVTPCNHLMPWKELNGKFVALAPGQAAVVRPNPLNFGLWNVSAVVEQGASLFEDPLKSTETLRDLLDGGYFYQKYCAHRFQLKVVKDVEFAEIALHFGRGSRPLHPHQVGWSMWDYGLDHFGEQRLAAIVAEYRRLLALLSRTEAS